MKRTLVQCTRFIIPDVIIMWCSDILWDGKEKMFHLISSQTVVYCTVLWWHLLVGPIIIQFSFYLCKVDWRYSHSFLRSQLYQLALWQGYSLLLLQFNSVKITDITDVDHFMACFFPEGFDTDQDIFAMKVHRTTWSPLYFVLYYLEVLTCGEKSFIFWEYIFHKYVVCVYVCV